MTKLDGALEAAQDEIATLRNMLEDVTAVEQDGAHIVMEWREIGGIRIGLDAAGNAVRVEFGDTLPGWVAE